ncbi:hypothetical protein EUU22_07465 [Ciceribacter ferrooxidans]|uniref:Uncharacterized protein n=1 Tax=Ciceribacter ferrooxidans TaxID=2509717 RepID=A0A4Q2TEP6_9HYPH|nr:hypothetical protein EUU22_07465 [Ciceribacter ferrooxidans]
MLQSSGKRSYSGFHPPLSLRDISPTRGESGGRWCRAPHLPLEGGGRREAAGGGEPHREFGAWVRGPSYDRHPTPELRSDPPPQGEGEAAPHPQADLPPCGGDARQGRGGWQGRSSFQSFPANRSVARMSWSRMPGSR